MSELKSIFKSKTAASILMIGGFMALCTGIVYADAGTLSLDLRTGPDNQVPKYGDNASIRAYGTIASGNITDVLTGNVIMIIAPSNNLNNTAKYNISFVNGTTNFNQMFDQNTTQYTATIYKNQTQLAAGTFSIQKGDASIHALETLVSPSELTAGSYTDIMVFFDAALPIGGNATLTIGNMQYTADMRANNTVLFQDVVLPDIPGDTELNVSLLSDLYEAEPEVFNIDVLANPSEPSASASSAAAYAVTFLDCNGDTVSVQWIEYGKDAVPPTGFGTYTGYTNVTAHMDLKPVSCYAVPNTAD